MKRPKPSSKLSLSHRAGVPIANALGVSDDAGKDVFHAGLALAAVGVLVLFVRLTAP